MITQNCLIFFRSGMVLPCSVYLKPNGEPNYEAVPHRGDLPNIHFSTLEGPIWVKGTEIVAIIFTTSDNIPMKSSH